MMSRVNWMSFTLAGESGSPWNCLVPLSFWWMVSIEEQVI